MHYLFNSNDIISGVIYGVKVKKTRIISGYLMSVYAVYFRILRYFHR